MKKHLIFILIVLLNVKSVNAQFTLEHTFTTSSTFGTAGTDNQMVYMVNLEVDGQKFVLIDQFLQTMTFYNLDYTLHKVISFASVTTFQGVNSAADFIYISQHLFDLDDEIEFLFSDKWMAPPLFSMITQVVNEDGTIIFTDNGAAPIVKLNVPQQFQPIYNTTSGTKMLLSTNTGDVRVYSLQGQLMTGVANNSIINSQGSYAYPNPSNTSIVLPFDVEKVKGTGMLLIYTSEGKLLTEYPLEMFADEINISTATMQPGTYFYTFKSGTYTSSMEKFVVAH